MKIIMRNYYYVERDHHELFASRPSKQKTEKKTETVVNYVVLIDTPHLLQKISTQWDSLPVAEHHLMTEISIGRFHV